VLFGIETVFETWPQLLLVGLALATAEAVYVILGFGSGLIAVGSLALLLPDLRDAVVLLLFVNLPAELYVVRSSCSQVQWRRVLVLFAGVAVGIPIGAALLRWGEAKVLLTALGLCLVAVGALFLASPGLERSRDPRWAAPPVGLLSGVVTGLFGTGGPPLILYFRLAGVSKAVFRGNLMAIFLLMTAVRVPSYAALDLLTLPRLVSALVVAPAVLVGAFAGHHVHLRLGEDQFRRVVSVALVALGLLLIAPGR
jgi:uncharacterized membrane protein YfcA